MLEQSSAHLWARTNSFLPRIFWEQGMEQASFHINGFHVGTVMDAKEFLM